MSVAKRSLAIGWLASVVACISMARGADRLAIDVRQAIAIADRALVADGQNAESLDLVSVNRHDDPIYDLVLGKPTSDYARMIAGKLKGRIYWHAYYVTRAAELGGDFSVFVDARTGEVIYINRGR